MRVFIVCIVCVIVIFFWSTLCYRVASITYDDLLLYLCLLSLFHLILSYLSGMLNLNNLATISIPGELLYKVLNITLRYFAIVFKKDLT